MRILMLGNSFTFVNNIPATLAEITGAEVVHHTRGGARFAEHLNPNTKMGAKTQEALQNEKWDYVILQEMSNGPITSKEKFLMNVGKLCDQIRENGAKPILYATWAYRKGGKQLQDFGMDYDVMFHRMYDSYHEAAEQNHCLTADVGEAFYKLANSLSRSIIKSIRSRCQKLRLTYVDIHFVQTWPSPGRTPKRCSILWGIRISALR